MKIIPLSIPTPFYVGDVNVYLIKEDPITLIDVGPKTPEAAAALRERLAANGIAFADVRRIVLTHAHEDHCGLAKQVRDEAKNAEILVHNWETGHLFGRLSQEHHKRLLLRSGVPAQIFGEMRGLYDKISLLTDALDDGEFVPLKDEMELEFENGSLQVIHTPGHSPGSVSFLDREARALFVGDLCYLGQMLLFDSASDMAAFRRSLHALGTIAADVNAIYPAHGPAPMTSDDVLHIRDAFELIWNGKKPDWNGTYSGHRVAIHDFGRFAFLVPPG